MAVEIAELPALSRSAPSPGDASFAHYCRELFEGSSRLLRIDDSPVVFRNEDLRALAAHPSAGQTPPAVLDQRSFTATGADGQAVFAASLSRLIANQFFTANPPVHKPVRHVLAPHLMPRGVAAIEGAAARIATELARELSGCGVFDFCSGFAARLVARSFGDWIGMTPAEEQRVAQLMVELNPMFLMQKSVAELRAADEAASDYMDLLVGVAMRARAAGHPQHLNTMAEELEAVCERSDPARAGLVPASLGQMLASNLLDGFHTAAVAASSTVYLLLTHREQWNEVQADPSLARAAVREALRLLSPLTITQRYALADMEYEGVRIPADTGIVMLWAVGNRDPAAFPEPDRFLLTRQRRHEVTFGGGVHVCPGRYIADMIAQVTVREVCRQSWQVTLDTGGVQWVQRSILCQLAALPVRLDSGCPGSHSGEKAGPAQNG